MGKRIFLATSGSRGDVEPIIAPSKALKAAGYDVLLSAPPDYAEWITSHGVAHQPAGEPMMVNMSAFSDAIENNGFIQAMARAGKEERLRALFKSVAEAIQGADLLIYTPMLTVLAFVAEARGTPAIEVYLAPAFPTRDFAVPFQSPFTLGRLFNRLSHRAVDLVLLNMFRPLWNKVRSGVPGLKPLGRLHNIHAINGKPVPLLFAVSETLVPRPRDWPGHAIMTGNFFLDGGEDWKPPADPAAFLVRPLYIGFGSMPMGQTKTKAGILLVVIARGWSGWGDAFTSSDSVHIIGAGPHRQLFPLMAGLVHHGGAGTTAAGLLAGKPTLATPRMMDQYFANLIARPQPLPVKHWRVDGLAKRLVELTGVPGYARRAQELAASMSRENGQARALEVVKNIIGPP